MSFVKRTLTTLVFALGTASLLLYASLFIGSFWREEPSWWALFVFIFGLGLGTLTAQVFHAKKEAKRLPLAVFGVAGFAVFSGIIGLMSGATLGGNGIIDFEFGGLIGYESAGLIFAMLFSGLGTYIAYRTLAPKKLPAVWVLCSVLIGVGLELLLGSSAWISGPLFGLIFFIPLIFLVGLSLSSLRPSAR